MPGSALSEAEIVQNPALGAVLLWRFGWGYQQANAQEPVPILGAFLVLPILLSRSTSAAVNSTQEASGLAVYTRKVGENREELLAIHLRALALRPLTFKSLATAARKGLVTINYENASFHSHEQRQPEMPEALRKLPRSAEKLGSWFAAASLPQTLRILQVEI